MGWGRVGWGWGVIFFYVFMGFFLFINLVGCGKKRRKELKRKE